MNIKIILVYIAFLVYGAWSSEEHKNKQGEEKNEPGMTPLLQCCFENDFDAAKILIENGADVNQPHEVTGWTPLHLSSMNGNLQLVDYLLNKGADPVTKPSPEISPEKLLSAQTSPLSLAIQERHLDVVNLFLKNKDVLENINTRNHQGASALHSSAARGYTEIMVELLNVGADALLQDQYQCTALFYASQIGDLKGVAVLLENPQGRLSIDIRNMNNATPLFISAQKGYLQIVKALVKAGANLFLPDDMNLTPLDIATNQNQWEVVKFLQEKINGKSEHHTCALCGKLAENRCSQCQNAYYCSRDHQKLDWKTHKEHCSKQKTKN